MTELIIPAELAAEIAADVQDEVRAARWLPPFPGGENELTFAVDLDRRVLADEHTDPFRSWTVILATGSVDGGPRPEPEARVLVLDAPEGPYVATVRQGRSGERALRVDAESAWRWCHRWALLPPPAADEAAPAPTDAPGTSEPAETVSPNPLRNQEPCPSVHPHELGIDCMSFEGHPGSHGAEAGGTMFVWVDESAPPRPWRVGLSWGRTIVESGTGTPDEQGRRPDDRLVGVVETRQDAERVVAAVNRAETCSCPGLPNYDGPQADCPVHGAIRAFNEASVELGRLREALRVLVAAADRMRDRWAEATPDVQNHDLWRPLHDAADAAREALCDQPRLQSARPGPLGERRDVNGELDAAVNPGAWKDRP